MSTKARIRLSPTLGEIHFHMHDGVQGWHWAENPHAKLPGIHEAQDAAHPEFVGPEAGGVRKYTAADKRNYLKALAREFGPKGYAPKATAPAPDPVAGLLEEQRLMGLEV